jgi:hypothetical protein
MSSPQQGQQLGSRTGETKPTQPKARKKPETPEEAALRWRRWRWYGVIITFTVLIIYYSWAYLIPWIWRELFPVTLPDPVFIEEVVAEFEADPQAAEKKYENKRIVVTGKLFTVSGRVYFQLSEGEQQEVECDYFDIDDVEGLGTKNGEEVTLTGVMRRSPTGAIRLVGAGGYIAN